MHNSLNLFAQRISKLSIRSSLHTDSTLSTDEASEKLPPSIESLNARIDRSVISLPVPCSFVDLCQNDGLPREAHPNQSSIAARRKQSEMPLSCHPPFERSWIEVQPLRLHSVKTTTDLRPGHQHSSISVQGPSDNGVYNKPSRATSSRPYNGIFLPSPPLPPSAPVPKASERRKRPYAKPPRATLPATTLSNNVEQPIAPLTPRRHKDLTRCLTDSPLSSGAGTTPEQHPSVDNPNRNSIPLPATLRDRWANRKSSHVILADTSLQLKVFSELGVELDEVLSLYTPRKMS